MDALKVPILPVQHQSSTSETVPNKPKPMKSIFLLTFITLGTTLGLFSQSTSPAPGPSPSGPLQYSVIIDAGSSGTRVHVFKYRMESGIPVVSSHAKNESKIGLATCRNDNDVKGLLEPLVTFAKENVTQECVGRTEIRLMATAGMRMLEKPVQEAILNSARTVFRTHGFKFEQDDWASVISGSDEGLYAWIVANYAIDSLVNNEVPTRGIVELGGASAQVTFVPTAPVPDAYSALMTKVTIGDVSHNVYGASFLGFGLDEALEKLWRLLQSEGSVTDPCTPRGYKGNQNSFRAAGNYTKCRHATRKLFKEGNDECSSSGNCYIGSTLTPLLEGDFFATGSFVYTSNFFNLGENNWLRGMLMKGSKFCGKTWSEIKSENSGIRDRYLSRYCFSAVYIAAMLQDTFRLDQRSIKFADKAGDSNLSLDWAMGAFILKSSTNNSISRQNLSFSNLPIFKLE